MLSATLPPPPSPLISSVEITHHATAGTCLTIEWKNGGNCKTVIVPMAWFRDNSRRPNVSNNNNNGNDADLHMSALNILQDSRIYGRGAVTFDGEKLSIEWVDGHKSEFDAELLMQLLVKPQRKQPSALYHLWSGLDILPSPALNKSTFSYADFARKFVQFGVVAVEGIEHTIEATKGFACAIAPLHETFYGPIWTVSNYNTIKEDYHTAVEYSNAEVGPHTDWTFARHPPGVVVFHCLRPADEGGETTLVDGFAAAERLKRENPAAFRTLTTILIDHHYVIKGEIELCLWAPSKPVIELNPDGGYAQIRFHPCHRAPLRLNVENGLSTPEDVVAFYEAYQLLFIDNFRILHARTAFSGYRQMCGCYVSRDGLMAKARPHLDKEVGFRV